MKTRNIVIDLFGDKPGIYTCDGPVKVTFVRGEDDMSTEPEEFEYLGESEVYDDDPDCHSTKEEVQDFVAGVKEFGRDPGQDSADDSADVFLNGVPEGHICVVTRGDEGGVYTVPGDYSEIIGGFLHVFDSGDTRVRKGCVVSVATFPIANVEAVIRG